MPFLTLGRESPRSTEVADEQGDGVDIGALVVRENGISVTPTAPKPRQVLALLALHRSGRSSEALGAYQRLRTTLVRDLGLEPSAALGRVRQSIMTPADDIQGPFFQTG